ncbi:TPA: hypothetical protein EYP26_01280 [Candidatus Bathyarchaeota archaeon]|nr:hypothetical protein [Candidatus Bathyarchaeota archaeon]
MGFGSTELKIDVKSGLEKYVKLLLGSSLKVRAIVLMGSRARGTGKPIATRTFSSWPRTFPKTMANF